MEIPKQKCHFQRKRYHEKMQERSIIVVKKFIKKREKDLRKKINCKKKTWNWNLTNVLEKILGKKAAKNLKEDEIIKISDFK